MFKFIFFYRILNIFIFIVICFLPWTFFAGHRMVVYKKNLVVFGGFHDNMKRAPKYHNDVHIFNLDAMAWTKLAFPAVMLGPDARSGASHSSLSFSSLPAPQD